MSAGNVSWSRRVRSGGLWCDGGDVPLDEAAEHYDAEVLDADADVVRTAFVVARAPSHPVSR